MALNVLVVHLQVMVVVTVEDRMAAQMVELVDTLEMEAQAQLHAFLMVPEQIELVQQVQVVAEGAVVSLLTQDLVV